MPRPLVFSNGSFFIGIDPQYAIRDLFYPQVGRYNHLSGHPIRMGVWVNGKFSWVHDEGWEYGLHYKECSLIGESELFNSDLKIRISSEEGVSHRENWFVRKMKVQNLSAEAVEVRVFLSHDLRIMESDIGDTAFYHPFTDAVIHYKGPCYFLFGGQADGNGIFQYATGLKGFQQFEGTWRDAEDGVLSMNPIDQGSVDSTISFRTHIDPDAAKEVSYWIVAADDLDKLTKSHAKLNKLGVQKVLEETHAHWQVWSEGARKNLSDLPKHIASMCEQSLLLVRTHIDNAGAIIAATDSDIMKTNRANYCYMWPRDGALVSAVLDEAGQHHLPRAFFEFSNKILPKAPPILRQKYTADGRLGATWHPWISRGQPQVPFQEDESALMILAMWRHHEACPDLVALKSHFEKFVRPAANYMAEYRDLSTGLPLPSYDLWEERLGVHTYTVASVIAGLDAASKIASALGDDPCKYEHAADQMRSGLQRMVDPISGVFFRSLMTEDGRLRPDWTVDASNLHVGLCGALPGDDPRVRATAAHVEERLWVEGLGGVARYEGDYYFRKHDHLPGNPWIICTCWLAQHKIMTAASTADLGRPLELIEWCCGRADSTGVLPEQVDAVTGEHLSVSPLTWSHAEFVKTCFSYAKKLASLT